jgi:MYXO-CTERM domain-containing protein
MRAIFCSALLREGLLAGIVALAVLSAPRPASACSCMEQPFEVARAGAVAIFEARVASIEEASGQHHVHMDVVQTWLEAGHEHVVVVTSGDEASCGYTFAVGQSYLVYASAVEGDAYRVSLCSRTRLMADADDDRALLGSGVVPVDIVDGPEDEAPTVHTPPSRGGCASCAVTQTSGAAEALGLLALLAVVIGRRRAR